MRTKVTVIVILTAAIVVGGWLAEQNVRDARYAETNVRPTDDISVIHAYDAIDLPVFRSREYVKIIRMQDNLEP